MCLLKDSLLSLAVFLTIVCATSCLPHLNSCLDCPVLTTTKEKGSTALVSCSVCTDNACSGHGHCTVSAQGGSCSCSFGWQGQRCEVRPQSTSFTNVQPKNNTVFIVMNLILSVLLFSPRQGSSGLDYCRYNSGRSLCHYFDHLYLEECKKSIQVNYF